MNDSGAPLILLAILILYFVAYVDQQEHRSLESRVAELEKRTPFVPLDDHNKPRAKTLPFEL